MSVEVLIFGLLAALACVLYLLFLLTARATTKDVAATIAVMKASQEPVNEEALAAKRAAEEQAILKEFDKNILAIFPPEPPRLGLSHFEVQQFLREKTNRN